MIKKFFCAFLAVIISASFCVTAFAADDSDALRFNEDGSFKILQIADTQDDTEPSEDMLNLLRLAIAQTQPDLIVLTGDNVEDSAFKKLDHDSALSGVKTAIDIMLQPILESGIPFTTVMGNNDYRSNISSDEYLEIYSGYQNCIVADEVEGDDRFNFNIEILASDSNKTAYNIWMMDTGEDDNTGDDITKAQQEWYESECDKLTQANGGIPVPSLVFQHMPVAETGNLYERCSKDNQGAFELNNRWWRLNPEMAKGYSGEMVNEPGYTSKQFESWKEKGDVVAAFFGHIHFDSFYGVYDGIGLGVTAGAMFAKADPHGVRVITVYEDNPTEISTQAYIYNGRLADENASLDLQIEDTYTDEVNDFYSFLHKFRAAFVYVYVKVAGFFERLFG